MIDSKTATECLREKLTELGKSYNTVDGKHKNTVWHVGELAWWYDEDTETGKTVLFTPKQYNATPEQAIAATLGSGECEMEKSPFMPAWRCSACDKVNGGIFGDEQHEPPMVCPNCGKAVKR